MHVHDTYFVIAHFHFIMVGGTVMAYMGGLHYWWPKMTGRMYSEFLSKLAALIIFVGFILTFLPQFVLGYLGMPRRYHVYPPEFQVLNVMSSAGASILAVGYVLPLVLSVLVAVRRQAGRPQSVGRDRPGMANALAAADAQFRRDAHRHQRTLRILDGGDRRCPLIIPSWPTTSRISSSSARPRRSACGCFLATEILIFGAIFTGLHRLSSVLSARLRGRQRQAQRADRLHQYHRPVVQQLDDGPVRPRHARRPAANADDLPGTDDSSGRHLSRSSRPSSITTITRKTWCPAWRFDPGEWTRTEGPEGPINPQHVKLMLVFYYIMTGLHAVHMLVGMGLLIWLVTAGASRHADAGALHGRRGRRAVLALRRYCVDFPAAAPVSDRHAPRIRICIS